MYRKRRRFKVKSYVPSIYDIIAIDLTLSVKKKNYSSEKILPLAVRWRENLDFDFFLLTNRFLILYSSNSEVFVVFNIK